jgi:hypothetical protein
VSLEPREILAIGPTDRFGHYGRRDLGEARRLPTVAERHPGAAVYVLPRVGRFHRERTLGGSHHEPHPQYQLRYLVGVLVLPTEESGDEGVCFVIPSSTSVKSIDDRPCVGEPLASVG